MVKILESVIFFSLQNSQISRLLQECSLQPALRWKISCIQLPTHFVQQYTLLTLEHVTSRWLLKKKACLSPPCLHLEKNIRPGNCKISEAPMRLLCIGTTHPQTSFNKPLHRGTQGWGRAAEPHTNHILLLRSPYPFYMGLRGKRRRFKISSLSGRADSHLMPHSQHCQKLHKAITRSPGSYNSKACTGGTAHAKCTFPEI